jgi:LmbE family N-acetylglucosaminyl deacetylase
MHTRLLLGCAAALALALASCSTDPPRADAPAVEPLRPIAASDRVLILAPHEDDEAIATAGVIQRALSAGAAVRIVYLTYGDHNEFAFMAYRKEPYLSPSVNRGMGELRRTESLTAMATLGVSRDDMVFLGYPDYDTLAIWERHWGAAQPLHSTLTNASSVPYSDAAAFGHTYKGEEILADLKDQVRSFRPTLVFVSHPADANSDHRAFYLFARVALWELDGAAGRPELLCYPAHFAGWPEPRGYRPELPMAVPPAQAGAPGPAAATGAWRAVDLTPQQVERKHAAILIYKTQMSIEGKFLESFARSDELFCTPQPVRPAAGEGDPLMPTAETEAYAADVAQAAAPAAERMMPHAAAEGLVVDLALRGPLSREIGFGVFAFGYRDDRPFADMPKLRVTHRLGRLSATDQAQALDARSITLTSAGRSATLTIPWELLGEPERVFVEVEGRAADVPVSQSGWHVVERQPETRTKAY